MSFVRRPTDPTPVRSVWWIATRTHANPSPSTKPSLPKCNASAANPAKRHLATSITYLLPQFVAVGALVLVEHVRHELAALAADHHLGAVDQRTPLTILLFTILLDDVDAD